MNSVQSKSSLSDRALVEAYVRSGSHSAFEEIVQRYAGLVLSTCTRLLGDKVEAEDALQATFLVLMRKANTLRQDTSLGAWLYRVATLASRDARRQRQRRTAREAAAAAVTAQSDDAVWLELKDKLDAALERLPARQREVLVLRYLAGKPIAQVAQEVGQSEAAAAKNITRGLDKLRQSLASGGLAIHAVALTACLEQHALQPASAHVLASLQAACHNQALASGGALTLTETVMQTLYWIKVKLALLSVAAVVLIAASGAAAMQLRQRPLEQEPLAGEQNPPTPPKPVVVKEGLIELELPAGVEKQPYPKLTWSPSGEAMLVEAFGQYRQGTMLQSAVEIPSAFYVIDAATGAVTKLGRGPWHSCRWLSDTQLLSKGMLPFKSTLEEVTQAGRQRSSENKNVILDRSGTVVRQLEMGVSSIPAPDLKHFATPTEPIGHNNYAATRKILLQPSSGQALTLQPPLVEKKGRAVGFRCNSLRWESSSRLLAAVVDMDVKDLDAPPGMRLNVGLQWHAYDLTKRAWEKLAGQALQDVQSQRREVLSGGTLLVSQAGIALVKDGKRLSLELPELKDGEAEIRAASADGTKLLLRLKKVDRSIGVDGEPGGPGPSGEPKGGDADAQQPADADAWGWFVIDLERKTKLKLELPLTAMGNFNYAPACFLEDGTLLLVDSFQHESYSSDPVTGKRSDYVAGRPGEFKTVELSTGKLTKIDVAGFDWPVHISDFDVPCATGGRLALLVKQRNLNDSPHKLIIFAGSKKGRVLEVPPGFKLSQWSSVNFSPAGTALAVVEGKSARIWVTGATNKSPQAGVGDF